MITLHQGDMFLLPADVRVNAVNCVGVMGAGVALEFRRRYPAMFLSYQHACRRLEVVPGKLHIWSTSDTCIVNLPTKRHWRDLSNVRDVALGLASLRRYLSTLLPVTVTMPALGCGLGGLEWPQVLGLIREYLDDVDADVRVFEPCSRPGS